MKIKFVTVILWLLFCQRVYSQPVPAITDFAPVTATVGASIIISGVNFSSTPSSNIVYFGAVRATVSAATTTQLTATVPSGATYGVITVTTAGLIAASSQPFLPTFSGGGALEPASFDTNIDLAISANGGRVVIVDLDDDRKSDLVALSRNSDTGFISIFKNVSTAGSLSAASFSPKIELAVPHYDGAFAMDVADMDQDGKPDLVTANLDGTFSIYKNISVAGTLDAGSFANPFDFPLPIAFSPSDLAIADIDNDGKLDVVTSDSHNSLISVSRNTGVAATIDESSFVATVTLAVAGSGNGIQLTDIDLDGKMDIIATSGYTAQVSIFRNAVTAPGPIDGTSFEPRIDLPTLSGPLGVRLGDLDGDLKPEIIVLSNEGLIAFSVYQNNTIPGTIQASSFGSRLDFLTIAGNRYCGLADLDGDGKLDAAVAGNHNVKKIGVFRNMSSPGLLDGTSLSKIDVATGDGPSFIAIGDLDEDTRPDLVTANFSGSLSISKNLITSSGADLTITAHPSSKIICEGHPATFSAAASGASGITYQWQFASNDNPANFSDISNGSGYSNAGTATLTVNTTGNVGAGHYRCRISGDLVASKFTNEATLTINASPAAPLTSGSSGCSPSAQTLTASGGTDGEYRWYTQSDDGMALTSSVNDTLVTPPLTATTTYYVSLISGACESMRTAVVATVVGPCNSPPLISPQPINTQVGGTISIDLVPLITTANNDLDVSSIEIVTSPASGATASVVNGILTISYAGLSFAGSEPITIRACTLDGDCSVQDFTVVVAGEIIVYNAVSPGGANPLLVIKYIELFNDTKNNRVAIYDRWENRVWHGSDYDNSTVAFRGISDNGLDLPPGTYFYRIDFTGGKDSLTGFLSLKR